ncbi:methyltransferase [Motilimonas eburnea]|uniref:methyltransferase n=1 Tax=Motilimonas eburnea TaxID=1737488 RepID=UPI001E3FBCC1|nr:methyltransferase [Motilimonas eburnea]MCE2572734.1 methyltransferase [Motilimonas eburnea]
MNVNLNLHQRTLVLNRYPILKNETLQAWDAADEYLINHCQTLTLVKKRPIIILNDSFGALATWFAGLGQVVSVTDSYIAQQASLANLRHNQQPEITLLDSLSPLPANAQLVLFKLPKNNRLLSWQLQQLCQALPPDCVVVAAAKAKDIHSSTLKIFEQYLGETSTSLAVKKARLVFCQPNPSLQQALPNPKQWPVSEHGLIISNHANVFSSDSLDIGARLLLQYVPQDPELKEIVDLGCGNGVISIKAAKLNPQAHILSVDESFMAVQSCLENTGLNDLSAHQITAQVNNCLDGFEHSFADLVLCNPPFHQANTITDHIAWQMFTDAKRVLRNGRRLIVIGNRQLGYKAKLKRIFGQVELLGQNHKFVVLAATKTAPVQ